MPAHPIFAPPVPRAPSKIAAPAKTRRAWGPSFVFPARPRSCEALKSPRNATGIAMTNLHRSPPMNQSETDLGIVNESQLLGFGISLLPIHFYITFDDFLTVGKCRLARRCRDDIGVVIERWLDIPPSMLDQSR